VPGLTAFARAQELNGHIVEIKSKADQSEAMVQEICRDIKKLDYAKKHLTSTITALRRLGMLVSAVEQLEEVAGRKRYRDAANLLEAVNQLAAHFEAYKDIPRIAEVRAKCASIKAQLQRCVMEDFSRFGREGEEQLYASGELADACLVVDALEPHVREELVATLCGRELTAYSQIFSGSSGEASHLDKVERRYAYIKRKVAEREAAWGVFPTAWRVGALIVAALCKLTRAQVGEVLDGHAATDVAGVLQALHRTLEFERELEERFGGGRARRDADSDNEDEDDSEGFAPADEASAAALRRKYEKTRRQREHDAAVGDRVGATAMESAAREAGRMSFRGAISSVFEPHMRGYIELEEKQLTESIEALLANETWSGDAASMAAPGAPKVLASASQVFLNIKKVLKRCSALTRGATLFALGQVFQRVLKMYASRLAARVPRDGSFADGEERVACLVINTAEYCRDTCGPLGESLARMLEPPWGDKVDMAENEEEFTGAETAALGALVAGAETRLELVLAAMARCRWGELESVGDQSEYVTQLGTTLAAYVPQVGHLLNANCFQFFCEKLAGSFAPRFYANIFRCRRFNESGAQQLLLDTHAIKTLLMEVPAMGAPAAAAVESFAPVQAAPSAPASYTKLVAREMNRAEALLKVIQAPQEAVGDMFRALLPDAGINELKQVCDLKGMKRPDAAAVLEDAAAKGLGGAAGTRAAASSGLTMPNLRLGGGLSGLGDMKMGSLGDMKMGLGDFKGLKLGSFGNSSASSAAGGAAADESSRLQASEAFRSAGAKLGRMGAMMKAGFSEASDSIKEASKDVSLPSLPGRAPSGGAPGGGDSSAAPGELAAKARDRLKDLFS
jgi:hypothetical protein